MKPVADFEYDSPHFEKNCKYVLDCISKVASAQSTQLDILFPFFVLFCKFDHAIATSLDSSQTRVGKREQCSQGLRDS